MAPTSAAHARTASLATPTRFRPPFGDVARLSLLFGLVAWTAWAGAQRPALREAEAAFGRKDYATALRRAQDDLAGHPSSRDSALIAARSLSQLIYADRAEPLYELASASAPLGLEALRDRAQGLIRSARLEEAADACRSILADHPDDPTTLIFLATTEQHLGRYAKGIEAAERLAKIPEGRADGLALLAMNHHSAKQPERAVAAGEALLAIDPELTTFRPGRLIFWYAFADDLMALRRPAEVRDYLLKVTAQPAGGGPDSRALSLNLVDILGSSLKELGDAEGAEARWRDSIRRDPSRLNPWSQLGRLYNGQKRFAEAADVLERAVAIEPDHLDSHYQLSTAYRLLGRHADARRHAERAEEIRRASPSPGGGMGPPP